MFLIIMTSFFSLLGNLSVTSLINFCDVNKYNLVQDMFSTTRPVLEATEPLMGSNVPHIHMGGDMARLWS
jgi:hypothetical protein